MRGLSSDALKILCGETLHPGKHRDRRRRKIRRRTGFIIPCRKFSSYRRPFKARTLLDTSYRPILSLKDKDIEQNHLCFGFAGLPFDHEEIYRLSVLSSVLGGGMSSRLFQTLREEKGLCYGIYTFAASHEEAGLFAVHAALAPKSQKEAIKTIVSEIASVAPKWRHRRGGRHGEAPGQGKLF